MIKNKYLKEWISANYPLMGIEDEATLYELDYLDMDKFADWLVEKISMTVISEQSERVKCPSCGLKYDKEEVDMFRGLCESCRDRVF